MSYHPKSYHTFALLEFPPINGVTCWHVVATNHRHPFLIFIRFLFGENGNVVPCFCQDFPEPNWSFTRHNVEWIRLVQEHLCRPKNDWVYHLKKETNVGSNTIHGSHYTSVLPTSFLWPQASSQSSSVSLILLMHTWYGENESSMSDGVRSITTLQDFWIINSTLHTYSYFDVPKFEKEKRIYHMVMHQKLKCHLKQFQDYCHTWRTQLDVHQLHDFCSSRKTCRFFVHFNSY